jgi:hypothetical protein
LAGVFDREGSAMSMSCKHWALLLAACLIVSACSASHDIERESESLNGGRGGSTHAGSGGAARAGSGGRAGSSGGAGIAGSGGGTVPTVQCGSDTCTGASFLGFITFPACCSDAGNCGVDLTDYGGNGCSEKNAPGTADSSCPGASIAGFLTLSGCCRPDGTCGAMDTFIGLGCAAIGTDAGTCTP